MIFRFGLMKSNFEQSKKLLVVAQTMLTKFHVMLRAMRSLRLQIE